ncbi:hypothetical protein FC093_06185 [Ilyomonas limi]|uniref:O-antigen ligase family protein n=1 Tax=Ilyomonas limi TaxID=2575867 RepID=A0A4U3L556_9BACT|nr:hypothetical protein [Ilyomonas limi]TKK70331.1 hypothetical protein FC093_06185 [Ilyomonas limi]
MEQTLEVLSRKQLFLNNREWKTIQLFWLGFILYSICFCYLSSLGANLIYAYLQTIGLVLLFSTSFYLVTFKSDNRYLNNIFILYALWSIYIFLHGFSFDKDFLIGMLYNAWLGILLYFVPLVIFFPINIKFIKRMCDVIIVMGVICLIYYSIYLKLLLVSDPTNLISQGFIEHFSKTLSIPCAFIILTYRYHPKKRNLIAFFVMIVTLLFGAIRARRGLIFMTGAPLFISYILFLLNNKRNFVIILLSIVLSSIALYFTIHFYNENKSGMFSLITSRLDEDTRTGGEEYFYLDMKTQDWIIGKGINGKYYGPNIDNDIYTDYRSVIETDYLQIILKGGIIRLCILLLIAIPAMILGIFSSKNTLSKALGLWILLWILNLYPSTVTAFTLNYLLVWIAVGICYNRKFREIPENQIRYLFKKAYKISYK